MGDVVQLEKPSGKKDRKPAGKPSRRRRRRSRTALVLGGGGFTGGVYEIGALRALDLLAVNKTVNQFDVYVGTSAGSFVAALAANGVTPEEMMRVVNRQVPTPFRDIDRSTLMRPNLLEFAQSMALLPLRTVGLARTVLGQLKGRELVDGGIRSTTNVDIAVERGAKFIVVVNPLVPYVNDFQKVIPTLSGSRIRRVSDMGFPQIGYQTFKLLAHQRLHEAVGHWREKYPGVDIVLIEPDPNDELMFSTNIMNYTKRIDIARHGFESVTIKLAKDYENFRAVCARHGIEISATRVRRVIKRFAREREKTRAWRRILEQTTGALLRQSEEA